MTSVENDSDARIGKGDFIKSTLALFSFCLVSVGARFYIRIRLQKRVFISDAFLLFGTCCLICAVALLFTFIDSMYQVENFADDQSPEEAHYEQFWDYQKMLTTTFILTWSCIASVKFSFLFLFKKLIERIHSLVMYWWVALVFNLVVTVYGIAVFIVSCPWFYNEMSFQCNHGPKAQSTLNYAVSQIVLDIAGDVLILYIPVRLIWQIQVRWTQKLALVCSLCLTLVIILVTVIRVSGLHSPDPSGQTGVDLLWELFWQFVSAEVGVITASATAFRSFFISRTNEHSESYIEPRSWYRKAQQLIRQTLSPTYQGSRSFGSNMILSSSRGRVNEIELPRISHDTIGIHTVIDGHGSNIPTPSRSLRKKGNVEGDNDWSSLSTNPRGIRVQHEISIEAESTPSEGRDSRLRHRDYF